MLFLLLFFLLFPFLKSSNTTIKSICGNGIVESGEECDDGNQNSLDGCSELCTVEVNYLCIPDPKTNINTLCFQDNPLTAELLYISHSNPPTLELVFNRPINIDIFTFSRSINLQIDHHLNGSFFVWTMKENSAFKQRNQSFIINLRFFESSFKKNAKLLFLDPYSFSDIFMKKISSSSSELTVDLPSYVIITSSSAKIIEFMRISIMIVMIVMLVLCLPFSFANSMGSFWNLFDSCQLIQVLLLINCQYTEAVKEFLKVFSITNFRLCDIFDEKFLEKPHYIEDFSLPYWIKNHHYSTMFIANAFYPLIFLGFFAFFFTILVILERFRSKHASFAISLKNFFGFSMILRTILITYIPFSIATMLQFLNFSFENPLNSFNNFLAFFFLFYLLIIPLIFLKLLNDKALMLEEDTFRMKIRPLIELLNLKAILKRNFSLFYTIRKFLWVSFIVLLGDDVLSQIFWVSFIQLSIITLHMLKRPYIDKNINYMLLFTEILLFFVIILIAFLICFDYLNEELDLGVRINVSWTIVGILTSIVFLKVAFFVREIVENVKKLMPKSKKMINDINEDGDGDDNFIEMGEYKGKGNSEESDRNFNTGDGRRDLILMNKNEKK